MQRCKNDILLIMRTTITFNDQLFKKLKIRAAETGESISDLVQDAVKFQLLEDLDDLETIKKRESEPALSFDQLVKDFKKEGLL